MWTKNLSSSEVIVELLRFVLFFFCLFLLNTSVLDLIETGILNFRMQPRQTRLTHSYNLQSVKAQSVSPNKMEDIFFTPRTDVKDV